MRCIVCDRETVFQMKRKEIMISFCYEHFESQEIFRQSKEMNEVVIRQVDRNE